VFKKKVKIPQKIGILLISAIGTVLLPLIFLVGLYLLDTAILSFPPTRPGLKIISFVSQTGGMLTNLYSPIIPNQTKIILETAENKYLSRLLIYELGVKIKQIVDMAVNRRDGLFEEFLSIEQKANDLLKQLGPTDNSRKQIAFGRELLPLAKWVMGFDRKKTFLIVLQNSMEQRPTGGLIEGVGIAVLEKGQLLDLSWLDPDDIEASLIGTEDSPQPIKTILEEGLLFRDANWSIDGPSAAVQVKKMYERSMGRGIDGVIFFSTLGLEDIFSKIGKTAIGLNSEITAGNLKERSAFAESDFTLQVAKTVFQTAAASPYSVIQGLIKSLQNENILIIPFDAEMSKIAGQLGIDGGVKKFICPTQLYSSKCSQNYIYIVDANLGGKRSDYFLKKNRRVLVNLAPYSLPESTLELTYTNTSIIESPSTAYRGYTRVVIPLESVIQSVVMVKNNQSVQIMADNYIEFGQHVIGFPLEIMPGEDVLIKIHYFSTNKIPIERGIGAYVLNLKKQTGDSVKTQVQVSLTEGITPLSVYPRAEILDNNLIFKLTMEKSDSAVIEFAVNDLFR